MKTKLLIYAGLAAMLALSSFNSKAQTGWTFSSPYIYSTVSSDKVGIGTTTPAYPLQLGTAVSAGSLSSGGNFSVGLATTAGAVGEQSTNKHAVFGSLGTNKDMLFSTYNGTSFDEWMRITYQGKVGIGTSSPSNQLDVLSANPLVRAAISTGTTSYSAFSAADIGASKSVVSLMGGTAMAGTLFGLSRSSLGQIYTNNAPLALGTANAYDLTLGTNNLGWITLKTTGYVGIGTTSPAQKLDVSGTVQMTGIKITTGATNGYVLTSDGSGFGTWTAAGSGTISGSCSSGANYVPKMSGTSAITCSQIYDNGTNVGIGTASPNANAQLEVVTSIQYGQAIRGVCTSTFGGNYGGTFFSNGTGTGTANYGVYASATNATTNIGLIAYASNGTANRGIEISEPATASANNYAIYSGGLAKSYFLGAIGIGNTAPSYKLDVTGDVRATGVMSVGTTPSGSYRLTINGDGLAVGGDFYPSDQFFKTEIDSLQNALATIKQLKPKTYYFDTTNVWGLNFSNKKQYGFLAQELEQVLPDIIKTSTKEADVDTLGNIVHPAVTFKAVNYTEFIAILTKGIQELQQKNDSLQTELNKQDSVNTSQQNQMNLIQNQLVANSTLFQDQLNQLLSTINDCCNRPQESSANNSQTKSMTTSESGTTQIDVELNNSQTIVLQQNHPNPYAEKTAINYYLPDNTGKAEILFYNTQGRLIKSVELINKGKGTLNVFAGDLSSGIYTYTLIVDGKVIETKKMVKQ